MRVVAGKHRGIVLFEFKGNDIRPTADRTKEAVFNILNSRVIGADCLDLFCGTGSLGIEALSRGASSVVFTDKARESVELTKKNLAKVKEKSEVFLTDAISYLNSTKKKFDIIFIDPPYADDVSQVAVEIIAKKDLLKEGGIIVFERDKPADRYLDLVVFDRRKYGKAVVCFLRKEKKCLFAGTFDPLTIGHQEVIKAALKKYDALYLTIMENPEKKPMFSLDDRLKMLTAVYGNEPRITVDYWSGMLVDYAKANGIKYNVRGIRTEYDMEYEKQMEEYNLRNYPDLIYDYITTSSFVSSTLVRDKISKGEDISFLVDKRILNYINDSKK